jgi:RNA polymerase sigma-70 factor (ECF subfamily)
MTALTNEATFSEALELHRRELQVHCYRMLGSFEESEDLTQETFLRAWRRRETYAGRASLRAWLYRIATNACLDALEKRPRTPSPNGEVAWLQPYPDELLDAIPADDDPDAEVVARETIELAFMVAIQHLAPRPRAVLIMRDILGWSAKDTGTALEISLAGVNSALQRARAGLKEHLPQERLEWDAPGSRAERELLARYVEASEACDAHALAELMHEDARFSMPPEPGLFVGRDRILDVWIDGGFEPGKFGRVKTLETRVNRQPAIAYYVLSAGDDNYRSLALDVLRIEGGEITEILAFGPKSFAWWGLPVTLFASRSGSSPSRPATSGPTSSPSGSTPWSSSSAGRSSCAAPAGAAGASPVATSSGSTACRCARSTTPARSPPSCVRCLVPCPCEP